VQAVKESAELLRRTWGENLIGNVGLGMVFAVAYIALIVVGVALAVLAAQAGSVLLVGLVVLVGVIALLGLSALHATMQGVYSAALYRYATDHQTPLPGFGPELLGHAFGPKK
jgi:hypothetical protein